MTRCLIHIQCADVKHESTTTAGLITQEQDQCSWVKIKNTFQRHWCVFFTHQRNCTMLNYPKYVLHDVMWQLCEQCSDFGDTDTTCTDDVNRFKFTYLSTYAYFCAPAYVVELVSYSFHIISKQTYSNRFWGETTWLESNRPTSL